jgi:hypothetical protein
MFNARRRASFIISSPGGGFMPEGGLHRPEAAYIGRGGQSHPDRNTPPLTLVQKTKERACGMT